MNHGGMSIACGATSCARRAMARASANPTAASRIRAAKSSRATVSHAHSPAQWGQNDNHRSNIDRQSTGPVTLRQRSRT